MRQGLSSILIAFSLCSMSALTMAEVMPSSIGSIDGMLLTKHSELKSLQTSINAQQRLVDNQRSELDLLHQQAQRLDNELNSAKSNLERDYMRMIDEPNLNIDSSQKAYQSAWSEVKLNQKSRLEAEQKLQELETVLTQQQNTQTVISAKISELENNRLRARVERLQNELQQSGEQTASFVNTCSNNMTLAQCSKQTFDLALQKAVKEYQTTLIENSSEANVANLNLSNIALNINVLNHYVTESGFTSGTQYKAVLNVQLKARPDRSVACKLLNVDTKYCFAQNTIYQSGLQQQEVAWTNLTIRSNLYDDKVTVNGISYGSTPVEVMVPIGPHTITVEKSGYRPFNQKVNVTSDYTVRATLHDINSPQVSNNQTSNKAAKKRNSSVGPKMINVKSGEYWIGQNATKRVTLDRTFAIAATPVTVKQFETFVSKTKYKTDAELQKLCTEINESEIAPIANSFWREPGFQASANSPVVCVSKNDAMAYINWLNKQTGLKYRLPSEEEWEIAARAGSRTKYWWGDDFGVNKANTGWSGSKWSNKSTSPVRSFAPNSWGMYDAVGNVWEWTNDRAGKVKGGAWSFSPSSATAHDKLFVAPNSAANYVGFRVLRDL